MQAHSTSLCLRQPFCCANLDTLICRVFFSNSMVASLVGCIQRDYFHSLIPCEQVFPGVSQRGASPSAFGGRTIYCGKDAVPRACLSASDCTSSGTDQRSSLTCCVTMPSLGPSQVVVKHTIPPCKRFPNSLHSQLPLLIMRKVFNPSGSPTEIERTLASNDWPPAWRYPMFPFSHFHSNVHEALGVFRGSALLQFGGDTDKAVQENVSTGDLILIPAGGARKSCCTALMSIPCSS